MKKLSLQNHIRAKEPIGEELASDDMKIARTNTTKVAAMRFFGKDTVPRFIMARIEIANVKSTPIEITNALRYKNDKNGE